MITVMLKGQFMKRTLMLIQIIIIRISVVQPPILGLINKILLNNEPKLQSILHINARSLAKNRHNIITELSLLNNQFSVIGMSEI